MAKSSLKSMQVPETLWGEAVCNVLYILNYVTTRALENSTPYQMWTGRKPNIEHVKVFGCVAHMKVTGTHLSKLVDRHKAMVPLRTETGTKAYRLLDPITGAISINRDVFIDEYKVWP